jgi:hypothetical protein
MLTKAQVRTLTMEWLDDPNSKRWSQARLDLAIQLALDDLWTDILDIAPMLTSQLHTFTSLVSPGYIDLRLTNNGGMLTQRFYRVLSFTRENRQYHPVDPRDVLISNNAVLAGPDWTYYVVGDQLTAFPLDTADQVELRYSYKPTSFTSLTDGMLVPFPDGAESAYIFRASAIAMAKGNAEDAGQLWVMANEARERCLASVRRQFHGMTVPFSTGSPVSMGGI